MAWIYKQKGSENWWLGYRHNGKQILRSTGTSDQVAAEQELEKVNLIFGAHRSGSLTAELFHALTGNGLPKVTLATELDGWLAEAKHQTASNTWGRYQFIADEFKAFLNATEKQRRT